MIRSLDEVTEFPLCWPDTKQRSAERGRPQDWRQSKRTLARGHAEILRQLRLWGVSHYVVSMAPAYRRAGGDPGVALWWLNDSVKPSRLQVLACDQYQLQEENLWAIGKTLDALRGIDRWGAYSLEQAQAGMKALPAPEGSATLDWRQVLGAVPAGLVGDDAIAIINARFRKLSAERHGDDAEQRRLNLAVEAARAEFKK